MPFDGPNDPKLPDNVANLSEDQREQWVAIWNNVFADCMEAKEETAENIATCEASAFAQANGVVFERGGQMEENAITRIWNGIKALFEKELIERRIKQVDEWDGSASQWDSTEAYCADCLIDVNSAAGREEKAQSHCKLPIREPGDSDDTFVWQAATAAVQALAGGRGGLVKPDDVPQADWESAVQGAARQLIDIYAENEGVAPASIFEIADEEMPEDMEERAKSIGDVYASAYHQAEMVDPYAWILDLFVDDDGSMFVVIASAGKLYRAALDNEQNLGEWVEVMQEFIPVQQSNTLRQLDDGTYQLVSISGTTVLNRQGEIDSRNLFDSFERHFFEHQVPNDEKPIRMFYHQGAAFRTGVIDFVAREGDTLVTITTYDDSELAQREIAARQKEPDYWGDSVGFMGDNPEMLAIREGIEIPVYTSGVLREVSTLPEAEAAAWFTQGNIQEVVRMNARAQEALVKLFDGNEEAAQAWLTENADELNRSIAEGGLLTRSTDETEEPEAVEPVAENADESAVEPTAETPEVEDEPKEDDEVVIEVDETLMAELAERTTAPLLAEIEKLTQQLDEIAGVVNDNAKEQAALNTRVAGQIQKLQADEDDKLRQKLADMPRRQKTHVTYRPRTAKANDNGDGKPDMATTAESTLKNLP